MILAVTLFVQSGLVSKSHWFSWLWSSEIRVTGITTNKRVILLTTAELNTCLILNPLGQIQNYIDMYILQSLLNRIRGTFVGTMSYSYAWHEFVFHLLRSTSQISLLQFRPSGLLFFLKVYFSVDPVIGSGYETVISAPLQKLQYQDLKETFVFLFSQCQCSYLKNNHHLLFLL